LGVNVNDELIALNGVRIENNIDDLFLKLGEPKELTLVVNRAGLLREIKGNFSTFPEVKYEFLLPATAKGIFWEGAGAIQTLLKKAHVCLSKFHNDFVASIESLG